jgi:hypothetical protein
MMRFWKERESVLFSPSSYLFCKVNNAFSFRCRSIKTYTPWLFFVLWNERREITTRESSSSRTVVSCNFTQHCQRWIWRCDRITTVNDKVWWMGCSSLSLVFPLADEKEVFLSLSLISWNRQTERRDDIISVLSSQTHTRLRSFWRRSVQKTREKMSRQENHKSLKWKPREDSWRHASFTTRGTLLTWQSSRHNSDERVNDSLVEAWLDV